MIKNPTKSSVDQRLMKAMYSKKSSHKTNKVILQKLILVLFLGGLFTAVKIVGGVQSHSLALISDAAHLFADVIAFVIAILSVWMSNFPATNLHSFGYHRAGIIGAMVSILILWVLNAFLVYYAYERVKNPSLVNIHANLMLYISCFGLFVNLIMIYILRSNSCLARKRTQRRTSPLSPSGEVIPEPANADVSYSENLTKALLDKDLCSAEAEARNQADENIIRRNPINSDRSIIESVPGDTVIIVHNKTAGRQIREEENQINTCEEARKMSKSKTLPDKENINIRATVVHIIGDIFQSVTVIIASLVIWKWPQEARLVDPILTFVFAFIIFVTSIKVIIDCVSVLMEGAPRGFSVHEFEEQLKQIEGVVEIHDLHVWCLGVGQNAMSAHIFTNLPLTGPVLRKATALCRVHGIFHSTIQVEKTNDESHEDFINCKHNVH